MHRMFFLFFSTCARAHPFLAIYSYLKNHLPDCDEIWYASYYLATSECHPSGKLCLFTVLARAHVQTFFRPSIHTSVSDNAIVTKFYKLGTSKWVTPLRYASNICIFHTCANLKPLSGHTFMYQESLNRLWRNLVCWLVSNSWAVSTSLHVFCSFSARARAYSFPVVNLYLRNCSSGGDEIWYVA